MLVRINFLIALFIFTVFSCSTSPEQKKETNKTEVILSTSTKGGGFELFGKTVAGVINEVDPHLNVIAQNSKGSKENLKLLESGKVDIGLVEGNAVYQAIKDKTPESTRLRLLFAMYPNPGMFVVPGDSLYHSISDLKGKKIAFGTRASGLVILAETVLDGLSLDMKKDFEAVYLNKAADGPQLVLNKEVAALWGAGIGWPGFKKVVKGSPGSRFIPPSKEEIEVILQKHPHLKKMTVPPGSYSGQTKAIDSVGLWSFILVKSDLPDEVVYQLARALDKGQKTLSKKLLQGKFTKLINTLEFSHDRKYIHPGVIKYMKKAKLIH